MPTTRSTGRPTGEQFGVLDWDSARFGFPVARVHGALSADAIEQVAADMRRCGIVLAYFNLSDDHPELPTDVLARVGGRLVDHRVTYVVNLATHREPPAPDAARLVTEYRSTIVSASLRRLARESGAFSRFRVDSQVPAGVFETIYDAWIDRSANHEIADEVLVARLARRIVGFVSLKTSGDCGEIGLLAVDASARGRGVGSRLVAEAHAAMLRCGCMRAQVATQRANGGACALYESAGYAVDRVERVYHLWLAAPEP